jgi:hypothetical protein
MNISYYLYKIRYILAVLCATIQSESQARL